MEDTTSYVRKLHEEQEKDRKNRERQGKGTPSEKLPTKRHGNNP